MVCVRGGREWWVRACVAGWPSEVIGEVRSCGWLVSWLAGWGCLSRGAGGLGFGSWDWILCWFVGGVCFFELCFAVWVLGALRAGGFWYRRTAERYSSCVGWDFSVCFRKN